MLVVPLTLPNFNKTVFVQLVKEALDESISGEPLTLLSKAFNENKLNDIDAIRDAGNLTRHFSYSFLAAIPYDLLYLLLSETDLYINFCETLKRDIALVIFSGSLSQWRDSIINCSQSKTMLLPIFNAFLEWFDKYGYQHLFVNYRRKKQNDGTYLLENKK